MSRRDNICVKGRVVHSVLCIVSSTTNNVMFLFNVVSFSLFADRSKKITITVTSPSGLVIGFEKSFTKTNEHPRRRCMMCRPGWFGIFVFLVMLPRILSFSSSVGVFGNKHLRLQNELATIGRGQMKSTGNSMTPILKSGVLLTFEKRDDYNVDDIVFCKVEGRFIDAHKVTGKDKTRGWLISNNHGWDNGWTKNIFGKVIEAEYKKNIIYTSK